MQAETNPDAAPATSPEGEATRVSGAAYVAVLILSAMGLTLAVNQVFTLNLFGFQPLSTAFYYLLIGVFVAVAFLVFPATKGSRGRVPWYDWLLALATLAVGVYFSSNAATIINSGWDIDAPMLPTVLSGVLVLIALEGVRRCGGTVLLLVCLVFSIYPLFADSMPGVLWGSQYTLEEAVRANAMGVESIIGIPMRVVADLLIGFIVFGVVLTVSGGGDFFMKLAYALMGSRRGGPAKVSILSSGFFGSLSGSAVSNVLSTGPMTIPTMKRYGYPGTYAAAVEACASTGGTIMPPIMGAVAFIMASFLNVPYLEVASAALVPALFFYLILFLQADAHAARKGLKGLPKEELPSVVKTLLEGWIYLFSLALLVFLLLAWRIESMAPFYASVALLVTALVLHRGGNRKRVILDVIVESGKNVANLVAILAGIGLVVGALSLTGAGTAFSRELIQYAGDNVALLLILGALTSFVLGMGMTASACYIFLAIVLAPALVKMGLDPVASHMFILYWGMLSYITPPVALASITAAGVAGEPAMKTAFQSFKLGSVLFILPFLFVVEPELILRGEPMLIVRYVITAAIGVWMLSAGLERYAYFHGALSRFKALLFLIGGLLMMVPGWETDVAGVALVGLVYLSGLLLPGTRKDAQTET
ncbi:TRAP transporter permease [Alloalcanivorax xenomutans]|uniref:TRAP transporter permease n=1 Tax=Alloalcanivorax xenomutans TaxID=1094342 RepID=UPI0009B62252|nr:TRAP transporter permease [Alloalcanivorax xenomutans]ARB45373.1 C4-dicarboxylate ABC transporter [Alloalcanivorax xenomutans]